MDSHGSNPLLFKGLLYLLCPDFTQETLRISTYNSHKILSTELSPVG